MGGCASKPKDLDTQEAPAPVENPGKPEKAEETTDTKTEEPLVDLSEAPKAEEAAVDAKEAAAETNEAASEEAKPSDSADANTEDAAHKAEEPEKEDSKDVAETEAAAPKPEDK